MKLVIQRVDHASVSVSGQVVGEIDRGMFVLVGIKEDDSLVTAETVANKLLRMRIMADENDKMNLSIEDSKGELLVVSQFTLYSDTSQGRRPSFIKAASPDHAEKVYTHFINCLKKSGLNIQTGRFGQYMKIKLDLDGPVTIIIEQ